MAREDLERLMLEKPEVGLRIMQLLSERLRRQETRLEDATMKDVHARLASIIVLLVESEGVRSGAGYRIPAHYTHERLGTMIGANRVAVTRAFGLLQDEGVVELRRRLIYVTDLEALRRSAAYGDAQGGRSRGRSLWAEPYRRPNRSSSIQASRLSSSSSRKHAQFRRCPRPLYLQEAHHVIPSPAACLVGPTR